MLSFTLEVLSFFLKSVVLYLTGIGGGGIKHAKETSDTGERTNLDILQSSSGSGRGSCDVRCRRGLRVVPARSSESLVAAICRSVVVNTVVIALVVDSFLIWAAAVLALLFACVVKG